MFHIRFMKAAPTTYVLQFKGGKVKREGPGLSFFYYAPTSSIVAVPLASADVPFVFNEITADFQAVTLQGQLTYRIADPRRIAKLLDFSIRPDGRYVSEDPEKLAERLVHTTQVLARPAVERLTLREALTRAEAIAVEVQSALIQAEGIASLGVEVLGLSLLGIRPTPEMANALEAEAREELQRRSDEAIYDRRNAAVEQERRIKESELATEIAVEEKKRQIRETQMAADIAVEEQRASLIDRRVANERKEADARSHALQVTLEPLKSIDWKVLLAAGGGTDPKLNIALAFRELAENAQKIGELNVSPDLLTTLLRPGKA